MGCFVSFFHSKQINHILLCYETLTHLLSFSKLAVCPCIWSFHHFDPETEISQQLLDGLPWHFVQTFTLKYNMKDLYLMDCFQMFYSSSELVHRWWILITFAVPCNSIRMLTFQFFCEISQQLLDGLPWNVMKALMSPFRMNCDYFGYYSSSGLNLKSSITLV